MKIKNDVFEAVLSIVLGVMLLFLKGDVLNLALTLMGVVVLFIAFTDVRNQQISDAVIKAVMGVCIIAFGWLFVNLALYIVAAVLIIVGLSKFVNIRKSSPVNLSAKEMVFLYAKPVLFLLTGVLLFLNQGGVIDWVFVVTGILQIIEGVLELLKLKK